MTRLNSLSQIDTGMGAGLVQSRMEVRRPCGCRDRAPASGWVVQRFGEDPWERAVWTVLSVAGTSSLVLGLMGFWFAS